MKKNTFQHTACAQLCAKVASYGVTLALSLFWVHFRKNVADNYVYVEVGYCES